MFTGNELTICQLDLRTAAQEPIVYRNTMLQMLYPEGRFGILRMSDDPDDKEKMIELLAKDYNGLTLDFAGGGRKDGKQMITDVELAHRYFTPEGKTEPVPELGQGYGSLFLTNCIDTPKALDGLRVRIVPDGQRATNDCHGLFSQRFALAHDLEGHAVQFRFAAEKFAAKGVIVPNAGEVIDADLTLPLSAFKTATKPPVGLHDFNAIYGTVARSSVGRSKFGFQNLQWYSAEALETDVIPQVKAGIEELREAGDVPSRLADVLSLYSVDADHTALHIIKADVHDQLTRHPWIVRQCTIMLRRRWLHLALGGGIHSTSLMACPDETLPDDTFSAPDLPAGEHLAYRNPQRSWVDMRIWTNDPQDRHAHLKGACWTNTETAASVMGDFDGDRNCFIPVEVLPAIAAEVRSHHTTRTPPPEVTQPKTRKVSPWAARHRIAYDQFNPLIGQIASAIARAVALQKLDVADKLVPELQIAIDKAKFDLQNDYALIQKLKRRAKGDVAWLDTRKDPAAFVSRPLKDDANAEPMARLARFVGKHWQPPQLRQRPLSQFVALFEKQDNATRKLARTRYNSTCKQIAELLDNHPADTEYRRQQFKAIFTSLREWGNTVENQDAVCAAFWRIAHSSENPTSTGSLAFHAFEPAISRQLYTLQPVPVLSIIGLTHGDFPPDEIPTGLHTVTVKDTTLQGKARLLVTVLGQRLGLLAPNTPAPPGEYSRTLIHNGRATVYAH